MPTYKSNGKLLLTGEYVVLDGALSLALPTKFGQSLTVNPSVKNSITWQSIDHNNKVWFEDIITAGISKSKNDISKRLIQILNVVNDLNPEFFNLKKGYHITTRLDFPKNWGLGTSSTLINNIASWLNLDPYKLLESTFGGSGYDIACAQYDSPITYQLNNNLKEINTVNFNPEFKAHLFFVFLNKKQNSRDSIIQYNKNKFNIKPVVSEINAITNQIIHCKNLVDFETLIEKHEQIISKIINLKPIKENLFSDFNGAIKSLGGWGGDFILAISKKDPSSYFKSKGFHTILKYSDMIL
ncbi:GHMP kinase [Flavobacteriaceae bacterium AU392]|nr:GHMP kinase [Flavobacteriaceae bacterium]RKM86956.1 GHMP kinase [Flavobacteriaceae bacterium AU392]